MVVKVCCLGDVLMATPALATLKRRYPAAAIDVAVGPWSRIGLLNNPRIERLVDAETLLGGRRPSAGQLLRVATRIRRGGYDLAVVLERGLYLALLPLLAGVPVRVGFDSGGRGATHTVGVPVDGVRHEADRYLDCAAAAGATEPVRRMELVPTVAAEAEACAALGAAGSTDEPYALIHPGGGTNPGMLLASKRWPPARFAAIADRLAARGVRPIVVWGPTDREAAHELLTRTGSTAAALGEIGLAALAALQRAAGVYIGNDTGPSHMAVAVGAPTVVVFGPSDERRFGPYGWRADGSPIGVAVANPPLASDDPAPAFTRRPVAAVTVEQVWDAVERQLATTSS